MPVKPMDIDYRLAFELAPVGMVLSRHRVIVDCNRAVCEMFGTQVHALAGQSFQVLYPSAIEFERTGARMEPLLGRGGTYADNRIMRRMDGRFKGETFWCHVTGRALNPSAPHESGIWTFEDLSASRSVTAELTPREREVAALVLKGQTSKQMGRSLKISHRTVEIYRARLMRKFKTATTAELVQRLITA